MDYTNTKQAGKRDTLALHTGALGGVLTFDIETTPDKDKLFLNMPKFEAPSNWVDPEKIEAYIADKEEKFVEEAALDIDFAMIDAIGIALGDGDAFSYVVGEELTPDQTDHAWFAPYKGKFLTLTEFDILAIFWELASKATKFAGFNIVGFDIPMILRRSFAVRTKVTRQLHNLKPWDETILDAMRMFYHNGYAPGPKYRGLKAVVDIWGIPNPLPDLEGSQYEGLDMKTKKAYVENDVNMTAQLLRVMKGYYW